MTTAVIALSLSGQIEKYGAYAGLAAVLGLAVLSLLYFAQAREVKRLREWAGRAPERAAELEERVSTAAQTREPAPAPGLAVPATSPQAGAVPAAGAPAAGGPAAPSPARSPGSAPVPAAQPVTAAAAAATASAGARPGEIPAAGAPTNGTGSGATVPAPGAPGGAKPAATPAGPPATPAAAGAAGSAAAPAGTPASPASPAAGAPAAPPAGAPGSPASPTAAPGAPPAGAPGSPASPTAAPGAPPAGAPGSPTGAPASPAGTPSAPAPPAGTPAPAVLPASTPGAPASPAGTPSSPAPAPKGPAVPARAAAAASTGPASASPRPAPLRVPATAAGRAPATAARRSDGRRGGGASRTRMIAAIAGGVALIGVVLVVLVTQVFDGGGDSPARAPNTVGERSATGTDADGGTTPAAGATRVNRGDFTVAVLNGTTITNLARGAANKIADAGFVEGPVTNDTTNQARDATAIYYAEGARAAALDVARLIKVRSSAVRPLNSSEPTEQGLVLLAGEDADVIVSVGQDQAQ